MDANTQNKILGLSMSDNVDLIQQLSNEFGYSTSEAAELVDEMADLKLAFASSNDEAVKLFGMYTKLTGASKDQAIELTKSTFLLAEMEGVVPSQVMKDLADNTELFAKFARDGGKNMSNTAIATRKLGLSLSVIEGMSSSLLDFQGSLQKEYEAEVMLGRDLELQEARRLMALGKTEEAFKHIVGEVGSLEELQKLNVFQQQALADAVGMTLPNMMTMAANMAKVKDTTKDITDMSFDELIGKDAMEGLTKFSNALDMIWSAMVQNIVPIFAAFLGLIGDLIGFLMEFKLTAAILVGVMTALAGAAMYFAGAALYGAVAGIWESMSLMAISTLGWGALAAAAIGGTIVAGIMMSVAKVKPTGDLGMDPNGGPIVASPQMGGVFQGKKGDGLSMGPGFGTSGGGTTVNVDTSRIEKGNSEVKKEMSQLRKDMASYFGFGGTASRQIGRETTKGVMGGVI
jgi:hypothetical protein